jgi:hypothetical protein
MPANRICVPPPAPENVFDDVEALRKVATLKVSRRVVAKAVVDMEHNGLPVDVDYLAELYVKQLRGVTD